MDQLSLSLLSGLLGSLIGAFIATWINRRNQLVAAVEKMLSVVYPIGFKIMWEPEDGKPAMPFHNAYPELWSAYSGLRSSLLPWQRQGFDKAWRQFMAMEFHKDIPDGQSNKVFVKGTVTSKQDAVNRCGEFINYIRKLR